MGFRKALRKVTSRASRGQLDKSTYLAFYVAISSVRTVRLVVTIVIRSLIYWIAYLFFTQSLNPWRRTMLSKRRLPSFKKRISGRWPFFVLWKPFTILSKNIIAHADMRMSQFEPGVRWSGEMSRRGEPVPGPGTVEVPMQNASRMQIVGVAKGRPVWEYRFPPTLACLTAATRVVYILPPTPRQSAVTRREHGHGLVVEWHFRKHACARRQEW